MSTVRPVAGTLHPAYVPRESLVHWLETLLRAIEVRRHQLTYLRSDVHQLMLLSVHHYPPRLSKAEGGLFSIDTTGRNDVDTSNYPPPSVQLMPRADLVLIQLTINSRYLLLSFKITRWWAAAFSSLMLSSSLVPQS